MVALKKALGEPGRGPKGGPGRFDKGPKRTKGVPGMIHKKAQESRGGGPKASHGSTLKPQFNKSEGTKDFILYSTGFVIAGTFYHKSN
jgi:hypothetical protein